MSNISNFPLFLMQESLIKTYATMYTYFSTLPCFKLFLLISYYFFSTSIFLLPQDEFIASNKQT